MIQTGLLAAMLLAAGLTGPARAELPSPYLTLANATEGWRHAPTLFHRLADPQEAVVDDVMRPPQPDIDPDMSVVPPDHSGRMRIILPPGSPGGKSGIEPR